MFFWLPKSNFAHEVLKYTLHEFKNEIVMPPLIKEKGGLWKIDMNSLVVKLQSLIDCRCLLFHLLLRLSMLKN